MRWLHSGGRGYRLQALQNDSLKISSLAYADDLCAITSRSHDLRLQAQKIEDFGNWGGLIVNNKKCAATGMLYAASRTEGNGNPLHHKMVQCLEKRLKSIKINTESVPFLEPDKPYCYLGVEITASMDWTHQVKKLKEAVLSKGSQVLSSMLSPKQILQFIQSSIRPAITYSMCLGIYTPYDIHMLDSILARIAKKALGLPMSTPTALILKDRSKAGVGLMSLMVDNVQINSAYLTKALNDAGPLGRSTVALLQAELKCMRRMPTMKTELQDKGFLKLIKYYHLMNRLSIIRASGLELEAPDGTMLTALGPDVEHLLNTIKLGEVSVPSRIYIPLMEIGLLGIDQCTTFRRGEDAGEYFIPASELRHHSQSRIRPRHKLGHQ